MDNYNEQDIVISTGNEIKNSGKWVAGILLIIFTLLPIYLLIAYWPDKLPSRETNTTIYQHHWFHVQLMDSDFIRRNTKQASTATSQQSLASSNNPKEENLQADTMKNDTTNKGTSASHKTQKSTTGQSIVQEKTERDEIDLNTILLILVALAVFLGSMIYTASSFTNFVGTDKFKSNWLLWYIVKPFTGMGLAIIVYFVFRAGLLNFNDPTNINLYGILTLATFAGLFTDDATLKLKEVFEVIFKPKDVRTDKLDENQIKITGIKPEKLVIDNDNNLVISGEGFDKKKLVLKINDQPISNTVIKGNAISFSYKIPVEHKEMKEFKLSITDENGKELFTKMLGI